ncbi:hypothetical protein PIB30_097860 [Stylosanthes scabra]|uniref:Uncharacterized protein n=1 Tax=Stylosanthes scabra TaxID=79078 RepID=A0ABU6QWP1_9FABA|nr:hypothetical protein [Stylosanthes scabra]
MARRRRSTILRDRRRRIHQRSSHSDHFETSGAIVLPRKRMHSGSAFNPMSNSTQEVDSRTPVSEPLPCSNSSRFEGIPLTSESHYQMQIEQPYPMGSNANCRDNFVASKSKHRGITHTPTNSHMSLGDISNGKQSMFFYNWHAYDRFPSSMLSHTCILRDDKNAHLVAG